MKQPRNNNNNNNEKISNYEYAELFNEPNPLPEDYDYIEEQADMKQITILQNFLDAMRSPGGGHTH